MLKLNKKIYLIIFSAFIFISRTVYAADEEDKISQIETPADTQEKAVENKLTTDKIDKTGFGTVAILQGLNKITAKTSEFEVKVGGKIEFGKLTIMIHKCWQAPLDQRPESKILMEIYETNINNIKSKIFYGWMFASTPSISGLEHPIYDITAIGCKFR
jgi:hypothetical protein